MATKQSVASAKRKALDADAEVDATADVAVATAGSAAAPGVPADADVDADADATVEGADATPAPAKRQKREADGTAATAEATAANGAAAKRRHERVLDFDGAAAASTSSSAEPAAAAQPVAAKVEPSSAQSQSVADSDHADLVYTCPRCSRSFRGVMSWGGHKRRCFTGPERQNAVPVCHRFDDPNAPVVAARAGAVTPKPKAKPKPNPTSDADADAAAPRNNKRPVRASAVTARKSLRKGSAHRARDDDNDDDDDGDDAKDDDASDPDDAAAAQADGGGDVTSSSSSDDDSSSDDADDGTADAEAAADDSSAAAKAKPATPKAKAKAKGKGKGKNPRKGKGAGDYVCPRCGAAFSNGMALGGHKGRCLKAEREAAAGGAAAASPAAAVRSKNKKTAAAERARRGPVANSAAIAAAAAMLADNEAQQRARYQALQRAGDRGVSLYDESPHDPRHDATARTGVFVVLPQQQLAEANAEEANAGPTAVGRPAPKGYRWWDSVKPEPVPAAAAASASASDEQKPGPVTSAGAAASSSSDPPLPLLAPNGFASLYAGESRANVQARVRGFDRAWASVSAQIGALLGGLNERCFAAVADFAVGGSGSGSNSGSSGGNAVVTAHDPDWPMSLTRQVPAALVFAGINVADHSFLFQQLSTYLWRRGRTPLAVAPAAASASTAASASSASIVDASSNGPVSAGMSDDDDEDDLLQRRRAGNGLLSSAPVVAASSIPSFPVFAGSSSVGTAATNGVSTTTSAVVAETTARIADPMNYAASAAAAASASSSPDADATGDGGVWTPDAGDSRSDPNAAPPRVFPVVLRAKDCPKADHMFRGIAKGLMALSGKGGSRTAAARATPTKRGRGRVSTKVTTELAAERKRLREPLRAIRDWYDGVVADRTGDDAVGDAKTGAAATAAAVGLKLVLVLEDLESFPGDVLTALIHALTGPESVVCDLPFVLVLGVATHTAALHGLLSPAVASRLWCRKFQLQPSRECFGSVVEHVLIDNNCPVHLGPGAVQFLMAHFLHDNFSVQSFIRAFHYMLLDHFDRQGLSFLCCAGGPDLRAAVSALTPADIRYARALPSVRRYRDRLAALPHQTAAAELSKFESDDSFRALLVTWMVDVLAVHRNQFLASFDVLCATVEHVRPAAIIAQHASAPLTRHSLYVQLLAQRSVTGVPALATLWDDIRTMGVHTIPRLLDVWMDQFDRHIGLHRTFSAAGLETLRAQVHGLQTRYEALLDELKHAATDAAGSSGAAGRAAAPRTIHTTDRDARRDELLKTAHRSLKLEGAYKTQVMEWFRDFCQRHLLPVTDLPFHEVFYYNDYAHDGTATGAAAAAGGIDALAMATDSGFGSSNAVGDAAAAAAAGAKLTHLFQPQPRLAIQTALVNSSHYLADDVVFPIGPVSDPHERDPRTHHSLEDACIAYRLYEESGRLINLYDWFRAFQVTFTTARATPAGGARAVKRRSAAAAAAADADGDDDDSVLAELDAAARANADVGVPLEPESTVLARFMAATATLRALGFIKPTGRKVDHVIKLNAPNV